MKAQMILNKVYKTMCIQIKIIHVKKKKKCSKQKEERLFSHAHMQTM